MVCASFWYLSCNHRRGSRDWYFQRGVMSSCSGAELKWGLYHAACLCVCMHVRVCVGKQWGLDPRTVARVSWPRPEYRMRETFGDRKGQSSISWFSHPLASGAMAGATRPPATFVILCLGRATKESSGVPLPFHSRGPGGPPGSPLKVASSLLLVSIPGSYIFFCYANPWSPLG